MGGKFHVVSNQPSKGVDTSAGPVILVGETEEAEEAEVGSGKGPSVFRPEFGCPFVFAIAKPKPPNMRLLLKNLMAVANQIRSK
jgi:hypothetical protein